MKRTTIEIIELDIRKRGALIAECMASESPFIKIDDYLLTHHQLTYPSIEDALYWAYRAYQYDHLVINVKINGKYYFRTKNIIEYHYDIDMLSVSTKIEKSAFKIKHLCMKSDILPIKIYKKDLKKLYEKK